MAKHLLFLVAVLSFIFANNGCTSKKTDEDQQIVENADVEKIEADGLGSTAQVSDPSLEAAMGESPNPEPTPVDSGAPTLDDSSLSLDSATSPTVATNTEPATALDAASPITETPISPIEPSTIDTAGLAASMGTTSADTAPETTAATSAPPSFMDIPSAPTVKPSKSVASSLRKIATSTPYQAKDGGWVNTVYIARPKEKLADISMKIFSADKSKELKKIAENKFLKSRSVSAGDKIYYVSPNRPDDATKTMLYYEDMGMVPEIYVAKKGENLKKVAKGLLGYDNAWKEVWASNEMESKSSMKDGDTFRYWKAGDTFMAAAGGDTGATLVNSSQVPEPTSVINPPQPDQAATLPPPPDAANANLPPPPTDPALAAAGTEPSLPPPPADLAPPPPPPPEALTAEAPKKKVNLDEAAAAEETGGLDSDTMMSMGALGILVAMMAFVIIRKKKQKAQMMNGEINA